MENKDLKELAKKYTKIQLLESLEIVSASYLVAIKLLEGCSKHPSYKAKRPPKVECKRCREMYTDRQFLDEMAKIFTREVINEN